LSGAEWDSIPQSLAGAPLEKRLEDVERQAILQALERTYYNKTAAAKLLGITFRALRYRLKKLELE
jgi:two-component system response regulator PilR (NtrC family)